MFVGAAWTSDWEPIRGADAAKQEHVLVSFGSGSAYIGVASVGHFFVQVKADGIQGGALGAPDCGGVCIRNRHELLAIDGDWVNQEKLTLDCLEDEHVWSQDGLDEPDVPVHKPNDLCGHCG